MIGIGIGSTAASAWWPDGAVMALDFANGRYMRERQVVDLATAMSFSRASSKLARNRAGLLGSFATNVPAITDAGLSVEPAATNLSLHADQIDHAWWSLDNANIVPDAIASPAGDMGADKVVPTGAGSITHGFYKSGITAFTTQRVFAKAGELQWLAVRHGGVDTWFDLGSGTIGTVGAGREAWMEDYGNGWYLCQAINTAIPNTGYTYRLGVADNIPAFVADGVSGLYIWCSEARAGVHPIGSSPIVTEASTATRAADVVDLHLPTGAESMVVTFDDGSTQAISGVSGDYRLPTNLARPVIRSIAVYG
jgi:hypothetical protein